MKNRYLTILLFLFTGCLFSSCKKQDAFLDTKPNVALAVPATLNDLQSLLNNERIFNLNDPGLGEISSDDYYVPVTTLNSRTPIERNCYLWAKQVYTAGANVADWSVPYQQVYTANTVLDYLPKITYSASQQALVGQVKGAALFYRSVAFYNLLQTFSLPYDAKTAGVDLGIPLRLSSDLNMKSVRAPEQQCYDQIIKDLQASVALLPVTPAYKTQPSSPAANALLSRVCLAIGDFTNAFKYADACLSGYKVLIDYNALNPQASFISTTFLPEDIFHSRLYLYSLNLTRAYSVADTLLYHSYAANDLRKNVFFTLHNGYNFFRGTYDNNLYSYSGIATDEVYLIRAECSARLGNTSAAMADLNTLLATRWKTNTFVPYMAVSADDALAQILAERRKELLYRGLRWTDLRRLNKDPRFAVALTRNVNGLSYTLAPNDIRYALPIPDNEIQLSGLIQNAR